MHYRAVRAGGQKHAHQEALVSQHRQGEVVTSATALRQSAAGTAVFTDHLCFCSHGSSFPVGTTQPRMNLHAKNSLAHLQTYSSMNIRQASSWHPSLNSSASGLPSQTCRRCARRAALLVPAAALAAASRKASSIFATAVASGCTSRELAWVGAVGSCVLLLMLDSGSLSGQPAAADAEEATTRRPPGLRLCSCFGDWTCGTRATALRATANVSQQQQKPCSKQNPATYVHWPAA